jgi:hypothetical protein
MSGADSLHLYLPPRAFTVDLKLLNFNSKKIDLITGGFEIIDNAHIMV